MATSYSDSINKERQRTEQFHVAETILERLKQIVLSGDEQARRRWFWELLQNACDVVPPSRKARIEVELSQRSAPATLTFRHNGGSFTSEDLVRLTQQSSNKRKWSDREEISVEERPESIGRFGTGFLTTHLLSKKVKVGGILHDEGKRPRRFTVPLDRTGETPAELQEGVQKTFEALEEIDDSPVVEEYQPDRLNTTFHYRLDDRGIGIAQDGVEEADRLLPYVMAFNQRIGQAVLPHRDVSHVYRSKEVILDEAETTLEVVRLARVGSEGEDTSKFAVIKGKKAALALPVTEEDDGITVLSLDENVPRLFCGFPLIGTSRFPLPVVVNSRHFHPTEKRNGIWLTESDQEEPTENRRIFEEVAELYQYLIEVAASKEWNDLFHLAHVTEPDGIPQLSESWYSNRVMEPIHETLVREPLVEVASGERRPIRDEEGNKLVHFPNDDTKEAREAYWELQVAHRANILPKKSHIHEWSKIRGIIDIFGAASVTVTHFVNQNKGIDELSDSLEMNVEETIVWLRELYGYLQEYGEDKYFDVYYDSGKKRRPILPNQRGLFCVQSDLHFDDEISEELKDIALRLNKDYREVLLHEDLAPDLEIDTLTDSHVAKEITSRVEDRLGETSRSDETKRVFRNLLNWFDENPAYAEELFGSLYEHKHRLRTDEEARRDRQKAQRYDRLQKQMEEHGFSSTEELLTHLEQRETDDSSRTTEDGEKGDSESRKEILEIVKDRGIKTPGDLEAVRHHDPELFNHISDSSIEKLRQFLAMLGRVKEAVRSHLDDKPEYDVEAWTDHEEFPTVVSIRKHNRDIYLVLRPADQNKVIFYDAMELDTLELSTAELWVQAPDKRPVRLTSGHVLRAVGVEPQMGIRLPPGIFPEIDLDALTQDQDGREDQK